MGPPIAPLVLIAALRLLVPSLLGDAAPVEKAEQEKAWFGAELAGITLEPHRAEAVGVQAGVHLVRVLTNGPCHRSGFATGDILLSVDGEAFGETSAAALAGFMERLGESQPGDRMELDVMRQVTLFEGTRGGVADSDAADMARHLMKILDTLPPDIPLEVRAVKRWERVHLIATLGQRPTASGADLPHTDALFPGLDLRPSDFEELATDHVTDASLHEDHQDLLGRLDRLSRRGDLSRVDAMVLAHREPFLLPDLAESLATGFERPRLKRGVGPAIGELLAHASLCENGPVPSEAVAAWRPGLEPQALLNMLEQLLERSATARERALSGLTPQEREHVEAHWREVLDRFEQDIYLYDDPDTERAARNEETIRIAERVDRSILLNAAHATLQPLGGDWLRSLSADLEAAGLDTSQATVLERKTEWGRIRIAGTGDDYHRRGTQGDSIAPEEMDAILIDLGGDDVHTAGATTVDPAGRPVLPLGVLIDLAGDDAYESTQDGAQGAGVLGVAMLLDLGGDDVYTAYRWGQAAGWMGVGLLIDRDGQDRYQARSLAQGIGAWGLGLLIEEAGDDYFRALRYGQGVGLAGGSGVLSDRAGDDEYYCKGNWPTSYQTPGVYDGWGQGCGIGFRGNASGGVGMLLDGSGEDRYEAGNFSQGGGYYYGLGVQVDRGRSDDVYIGSRYNQGFSAHQAAGFFLEEGGDDLYETRNLVCQGLAWDESITFFVDERGDDRYRGGGFSLGASAHNSICVFHELSGDDVYLGGNPGRAGGNDYHGGTSLSLFLDEGGGRDSYPGEDRNETSTFQPEHGLVIDR